MARTAARSFLNELDAAGVRYELIPHAHTETAIAEAEAIGVEPAHVAKTIILVTRTGFVRAVLPASKRLDMDKVRDLLDTPGARLASEQMIAGAYPGFELGAVPPFGGPRDQVLIDGRLCVHESVVMEAGCHDESVRIRTKDLVRITGAMLGDLVHD
jgi:Ala-tRNA(Pro) deacylase